MPREIERKFLLSELPAEAGGLPAVDIEQGYLALEEQAKEVRLRRTGEACTLTVKTHGELARQEYEIRLSEEQFRALWPATEGRRLQKKRYFMEYDELTIEIDAYRQPLRGLLVAEIEFPSEEAARSFRPPGWLGREVTDLNFLKNRNLLQFDSVASLMKLL